MLETQYKELKNKWIINWCWAKWSFNFSRFYKENIVIIESFNPKLNLDLIKTIELKACWPHDVDYYNGNSYLLFIVANFKFSYRIFKILKWTWSITLRLEIAFLLFMILHKKWKNSFNFWKKRYIIVR